MRLDGELVAKLASDPLLLGDVLYAVCKPQADKEDVTDEQFGEGLAGDSIAEATNALIEAIVAYLPEQKRRLMEKAAEKQRQIETRGLAAVEKHLDDPNLVDRVVQDLERNLQASALNASSPTRRNPRSRPRTTDATAACHHGRCSSRA